MNNMANYFKSTRPQDVPHVSVVNDVNAVSSQSHNLGAMTKQTSGKTGRKRIDNIERFNIDPTSLIDDNAQQNKKTKVISLGTITKPNAIDIGVLPEARMEEVLSKPSLCYPYLKNIPQIVDLQSKQSALGTDTMVSNNEDMILSVSTQGLHLIVRNIVKEKLFGKLKFLTKESMAAIVKNQTQCAAC
jgi:hypothetical protein